MDCICHDSGSLNDSSLTCFTNPTTTSGLSCTHHLIFLFKHLKSGEEEYVARCSASFILKPAIERIISAKNKPAFPSLWLLIYCELSVSIFILSKCNGALHGVIAALLLNNTDHLPSYNSTLTPGHLLRLWHSQISSQLL
jgi:hypothetical protein